MVLASESSGGKHVHVVLFRYSWCTELLILQKLVESLCFFDWLCCAYMYKYTLL